MPIRRIIQLHLVSSRITPLDYKTGDRDCLFFYSQIHAKQHLPVVPCLPFISISISERRNTPVPAVLLCGTEFSVSKGQQVDDSRYPRGGSNLASSPNSAGSNSYMSILGSPVAPRNNSGPSSPAPTTYSSITADIHARADFNVITFNEHYLAFRVVLDTGDSKDKQQLNKLHNKLLHLTPAQIYEPSTDCATS